MADDLKQIKERITHCKRQNAALMKDVGSYVEKSILAWEDTSEPPWHVIKVKLQEPPPISILTPTGQIVNELRSCLDSLATRLAIRNGKSTSNVYFPISKDAAVFAADGLQKIKKLSPADQKTVADLQPHGDANPKLFGFHDLDRNRKHVELGIQGGGNSGFGLRNGKVQVMLGQPGGPLEVGVDKSVVAYIPEGPCQFTITNRLTFSNPAQLAGLNVTQEIEWFAEEVERIVMLFD
ncbi:hypothetical protein [Bradyrhizobium sp. LA6.7]|uniref:hypothetical protein n=1 Tax=unclassified Bradyrhizobium TaxID=2631580 RepID=UPI003392B2B6